MTRILRMRGIPFQTTEEDIHNFFGAWQLEDVRICKKSGRPTGEAYVKFKTEKGCAEGMSAKDKEKLGKRYVELFKAKEQDLEQRPSELDVATKGHALRMRGLPFSACVADICRFFQDIPSVDQENVLFVYDSSGRPSGEAYVYFTEEEGCRAALQMDKKEMGSRYIELFPTHDSDIQRASRLGRLRSGKSENHSSHSQRARSNSKPITPLKPAKVASEAEPVKSIPNYKPVVVKQLTKTFANVAASSPPAPESAASARSNQDPGRGAAGGASAASNGSNGHGVDGDVSAVASGLQDKLVLDASAASSLFANAPGPGAGGQGDGARSKAGAGDAAQHGQQHGHHDGQVWGQWGNMAPFGMNGLPVYDMWSNPMLPKLSAHSQLAASFQVAPWQPSYEHMSNGAYAHGDTRMYAMHDHRQMDPRVYHQTH